MDWSLGAIASLCAKAARGAGRPWGLAEEAGWAVRWLSSCGVPGAEICATWLGNQKGLCAVSRGLETRDRGAGALPAEIDHIAAPGLLLPFIAWTLRPDQTVSITMGDAKIALSCDGMSLDGRLPDASAVHVADGCSMSPSPRAAWRVETVAPAALAALQSLAARTYAPASEQSRLLGAGAGLTDND